MPICSFTIILKVYVFIVPAPNSVEVISNKPNPIRPVGSNVTLICTVELDSETNLSMLMVDVQLSRDGTPLTLTDQSQNGTTFTYTIQLDSFGRNDSGDYNCNASVRSQTFTTYLENSLIIMNNIKVSTG